MPPPLPTKKPGVIVIEGHVQGLANTRLLGRSGIPVIVVDKDNCVARFSKYCTKYFRCPDYQSDKFADFLIRLHRAEKLQGWLLLPSNDHAVYTISKHKARLAKSFKVITEDIEVIERIYNKRELLQLALRADIPIPRTFFPFDVNPETVDLRYPVLIKGNNGLSFYKRWHHKAIAVESDSELRRLLQDQLAGVRPDEYFIQELIPDEHKTVSVTVFAVQGEVFSHWAGVKLRSHPINFGTATCCQSVYDEEMLELSKKLIRDLNYTGVCEIEWLKDPRDNEPKLIEINARTWLWVGLAAKCGINYPRMICDYVYEGALPQYIQYPLGEIWLNLYTDLVYSVLSVLKRLDSFKDVLKTYENFTEATWDVSDPLPFFKYAQLSVQFVNRR